MNSKLVGALALALAGVASVAQGATTTNTMPVKIIIQNACDVTTVAPTLLDFGTQGPLVANVDNTSTITFTCTSGAAYTVALNGGGSTNINGRVMTNGGNQVGYQLYTTNARTAVWGDGTNGVTQSGNGTGSAQTLTVYGRVAPQATPPAGTYNDAVTVTVTY
jgi:spore coat protein U-like protein